MATHWYAQDVALLTLHMAKFHGIALRLWAYSSKVKILATSPKPIVQVSNYFDWSK